MPASVGRKPKISRANPHSTIPEGTATIESDTPAPSTRPSIRGGVRSCSTLYVSGLGGPSAKPATKSAPMVNTSEGVATSTQNGRPTTTMADTSVARRGKR
jgi:hypothetical protein